MLAAKFLANCVIALAMGQSFGAVCAVCRYFAFFICIWVDAQGVENPPMKLQNLFILINLNEKGVP
jgi:hypothetical protein